jgi:hypothetical protein
MLSLSIDMSQIFSYAGDIVDSLMPVVYVSAGISLGFVIVNRIISAFR